MSALHALCSPRPTVWIPFNHAGGYYFNDTHIRAFSHTHLVGAGVEDYGNLGVMVTRNLSAATVSNNGYLSSFSHDSEVAVPGYYAVNLDDAATRAEMTVSGPFSGLHRYTCAPTSPTPSPCFLVVDVCHTSSPNDTTACAFAQLQSLTAVNASLGGGFTFSGSMTNMGSLSGRSNNGGVRLYFAAEVQATSSRGTISLLPTQWVGGAFHGQPTVPSSTTSGSFGLAFQATPVPTTGPIVLTLRVGISFTSIANAWNNLQVEQLTPGYDFDGARAATQALWESMLQRVQVSPVPNAGNTTDDEVMFYSSVYRTMMAPSIFSDESGDYLSFDQTVHSWTLPGDYLTDMSLWDTHRSEMPWLTLVVPERMRDTTNSLLRMALEGGHLPRWPLANVYTGCMDGEHGTAVIADAVLKGVLGVDIANVWPVVRAAVETQAAGSQYGTIGYVPSEESSTAASSTLEYAFDDGTAAVLAAFLGNASEAQRLSVRAGNWRNVFTTPLGETSEFPCPRSSSGAFSCPLILDLPYPVEDIYTEGDAWQWRWYVPHDAASLVTTMFSGSNASGLYAAALNSFFANSDQWIFGNALPNPLWWSGNEPDILAPWQFSFAGNDYAWLTQQWTRWNIRASYNTRADGLPGNDDYGTMSAWLNFAMIGFYPLAGTQTYILGSPTFAKTTVQLPAGLLRDYGFVISSGTANSTLVPVLNVVANNASPANVFVQSASVNGAPLPTPFVNHSTLFPGWPSYAAESRARAWAGLPWPGAATLTFNMVPTPVSWVGA